MRQELKTASEIKEFLKKYNSFHDALLKSAMVSSNGFVSSREQALTITGQFKAVLTLYHSNYLPNAGRKTLRFSLELYKVGPVLFSSAAGHEPANHWALTKMEIKHASNANKRWLLTVYSNEYDAVVKKWTEVRLAQVEFATLIFQTDFCENME